MAKDKSSQGIVLDEKSRTEQKDDELQPLREKSGF
jgi:hypothetical protein